MQSHTLIESQPKANDPLISSVNGAPTRMGPVPGEFLRPLPVLSSSNSNTTLKYHKKAAILNHTQNLKQELDAKYNHVSRYDSVRSNGSENTNGYNGSKDLTTSADSENENNQYVNDKLGSNGYPKHFASMQGPYGIINNSMFLKKEEEEARQGRSRFLSSDLLNNTTSDKVNSSQVKFSGQFQANYIGHLTSQNYLNRPLHVPNSQSGESALYLNGNVNGHSDSRNTSTLSNLSRSSPQNLNRSSPMKPESNQENTSQDDQSGNANKKFKVPTSKVPKESLLKYRILHKNNQRNVTQLDSVPTSQQPELTNPTVVTPASSGTLSSFSNGTPCDSNISNPNSSFNSSEASSNNNRFKRPADAEPHSLNTSQGDISPGVINSEIQPNHFSKGVLIKLESGLIKHLEDLKTEDFVTSAEKSTKHRLEPSAVMKMEEKPGSTHIVLTLCYGEKRHQVEYESLIEQPYYVIDKGWSSYSPARTHNKYGLVCKQLNVGDTCISLCQKSSETPSPSKPVNQAKINKRKELEKHFNLLTSKDREMNERKKRRWSAPDQIHEKTNKKNVAKQSKPNEENGDTTSTNVKALPTSTNFQNSVNVTTTSYQPHESFPNSSYFNQYPTSTISSSHLGFSTIQSLPSHLQYVSPISSPSSSSSSTHLTAAMTKPIVSHLPLSSLPVSSPSNFSISTLSTSASSQGEMYPTGKPSYLIHSSPSLPGIPSPPTSIPFQTSYASTPNFINGTSISSIYSRNGYPMKYSTSQPIGGKNNFSNVGTLAKSATQSGYPSASNGNMAVSATQSGYPSASNGNMAVDFSKYSTKK